MNEIVTDYQIIELDAGMWRRSHVKKEKEVVSTWVNEDAAKNALKIFMLAGACSVEGFADGFSIIGFKGKVLTIKKRMICKKQEGIM